MTTVEQQGPVRDHLFDTRYGELLFATIHGDAITADVWTTFTLNDCPSELWDPIDPETLAARTGATFVIKNGPRYWLIDEMQRATVVRDVIADQFDGLDMIRVASVSIDLTSLGQREYRENVVDRRTLFTWRAGRRVYELTSPDGATYVMQAYCQIVDPALREADLAALGSRLELPEGWSYRSRVLEEDLLVDTRANDAYVTQDELQNSYCRID